MKIRFLFAVVVLMSFLSANAFEGEIKYRTYTNYSPEMLAQQPLLFNGENYATVIIKGDKMMAYDDRKGTVTISTSETFTEYAPSDNTGYSCPVLDYSAQSVQFPAQETTQTREMLGITVTKYVRDKNANIGMEFYGWISKDDFGLSPKQRELLNCGMNNVPGLAIKFTHNMQGATSMFVCHEILSITPREVADSEFDIIPADAKMDIVTDWNNYKFHNEMLAASQQFLSEDMKPIVAFSDFYNEFFKAHPVKPQKIDKESYELDEDWDF